jgi:hypothetical protein
LCEDGCAQNHQEKCEGISHLHKGSHSVYLTVSKFVDPLEPKKPEKRICK